MSPTTRPASGSRRKSFDITVENLYHSGLAKFANAPTLGASVAGAVAPFPQGNHGVQPGGQFITELLGDQASFHTPFLGR